LVEIMVGMLVFTLLALGMTSSVLQTRRLAQLNIVRNTAYTIAQGYMEQMMSIDPTDMLNAAGSGPTHPLPVPTMSVSYLTAANSTAIQTSDPLYVSPISNLTPATNVTLIPRTGTTSDVWNVKNVMIAMNDNGTPITMTEDFDLNIVQGVSSNITNGNTSISLTVPAFLIELDFQYTCPAYPAVGTQNGTLRVARTDVAGI
jgi:hypothetical protein